MRLIDADALKKVFHAEWDDVLVWDESGETTADAFCNLVDDAPTIEAKPVKHGKWEHKSIGGWHCSECGEQAPFWCFATTQNLAKYCPNCGAKMDGAEV